MNTEENNQAADTDTETKTGEGEGEQEADVVKISKTDFDKLNQTLGSLKRELKDLKKSPKEELKETPKSNQTDESNVLQKLERLAFRQAGISHLEDIELAQKTAKKWGVDIDEVLADEDFKVKLERQQTGRSNIEATSNIKGGAGKTQAKNTPEYWVAKGVPPSPADVPDRKLRAKIARAMMASTQSSKTFYND